MSWSHVIKLSIADSNDDAVLVYVTAKSTASLDLDLLATDGDSAFRGKVRERSLSTLRAKNYDGSDAEWKDTLKHVFVSKQIATPTANIEVSCSKSGQDPHAVLTITIRRRIENITQRLGVIDLPQIADVDAVDLFGWASQLVSERDQLEVSLQQEKGRSSSTHNTIVSLQAQLADLVQAKQALEQDLLSKFAALLNEKKKELRKRAHQLGSAQVTSEQLRQLDDHRAAASKSKSTRGKKRPAEEAQTDSESDTFERPAETAKDGEEEEEEATASDRSRSTVHSSSTDTAEDDDLDQPNPLHSLPSSAPPPRRQQEQDVQTMPPKRALPFARKTKAQPQQPKPLPAPEDAETASKAYTADSKAELLGELRLALLEVGFLYIKNHGVDRCLIQEVTEALPTLFSLPIELKESIALVKSPHFLGYSSFGSETTANSQDHREQLEIANELPNIYKSHSDQPLYLQLQGPNQWPVHHLLPDFRPLIENYLGALRQLARFFLDLVTEALFLPAGSLDTFTGPQDRLKLVHYRPCHGGAIDDHSQGVGPHKDSSGWMTFLLQASDSSIPGLQVLTKAGDWINVPALPGTLVVNMGQAFEVVTNGVCKATTHRVLLPPGDYDRYSVPFFQGVRPDLTKKDLKALWAHFDSNKWQTKESIEGQRIDSPFLRGNYATWGEAQLRTKIRSHRDVGRMHYADVFDMYVNE
ncbi:hypothetical protein DV738_g3567, partial [Chaetothyriales sp. CBS 135597]